MKHDADEAPPRDRPVKDPHTGIRRVFYAAGYSLDGLKAAYRGEAAFRQLVWLNAVLIPLALVLDVSPVARALLVGVAVLSLIVELLNSAVEAAIDRISLVRHPLSKQAKDMGSAAQLLSMGLIALVWGIVLLA